MEFNRLSEREERIASLIVDSAFQVHKILGPGLFEKIYEISFCHELSKRGLNFKRQLDIPIQYDGIYLETGLRIDVLVEDLVICEMKSANEKSPVWDAQLLSHLKLSKKRLGFIINFNVPIIKNGIKRIIL